MHDRKLNGYIKRTKIIIEKPVSKNKKNTMGVREGSPMSSIPYVEYMVAMTCGLWKSGFSAYSKNKGVMDSEVDFIWGS